MKFFFCIITFLVSTAHAASPPTTTPTIHAASNIQGDVVVLEVTGSLPLRELNLKTRAVKTFSRPKELVNEEILGIVLAKETLVLIAQDTRGDGGAPIVFQMDRQSQSWKRKASMKCRSFDTVEVTRVGLAIACDADPQTGKKPFVEKVSLAGLTGAPAKQVLPVQEFKSGDAFNSNRQFKLEGPMFQWASIRIVTDKDEHTLSASDLANQ